MAAASPARRTGKAPAPEGHGAELGVRAVLHAGAVIGLAVLADDAAWVLVAGLLGTLGVAAMAARRFRPWSDAAAWLLSAVAFGLADVAPGSGATVLAAVFAVGVVATLLVPARGVPNAGPVALIAWCVALAAAVGAAAAWPTWLAEGNSIAAQDPASPAGVAVVVGLVVALALVLAVGLALARRRPAPR